jgi:hypothetical protein
MSRGSFLVAPISVYWGHCGTDGRADGTIMKLSPK